MSSKTISDASGGGGPPFSKISLPVQYGLIERIRAEVGENAKKGQDGSKDVGLLGLWRDRAGEPLHQLVLQNVRLADLHVLDGHVLLAALLVG